MRYTYTQTKEITDLDVYPNGYTVPDGYVIVKFDIPKLNEQFISALPCGDIVTSNGKDVAVPRLIVAFPRHTLNIDDKVSFTADKHMQLNYCGTIAAGDVVVVPLWQLMDDLSRIGYRFNSMPQFIKNNQIKVL
jgi:hypothetical protein